MILRMIFFNKSKIALIFLILFCLSAHALEIKKGHPSLKQITSDFHKELNNKKLSDSLKNQGISGRLNEVSCTRDGENAICIAVGFAYNNGGIFPLLVKSLDGGKNFTVDKNVTNYSELGTLLTSSCTASGNTAMCIAGGYTGANKETGRPLLIQSKDGGMTWVKMAISEINNFGLFKKASCTGGNTSPTTCIAVGWGNQNQSSNMYPILAQSTDGGKTWAQKSITNISPLIQGQLYAASCTGEGSYAMCVAVGNYTPYVSKIPMLVQTTDGGNTWINKKYIFYSQPRSIFDLTFTDVNCNGGNTNTICTIVGRIGTNDPLFNPIVYQTTDRGITWIKNSLETFPTLWNGTVNSVSCAGLGSNSFCAAAGAGSLKPADTSKKDSQLTTFPLILQSYGSKWLVSSLFNPSPNLNTLYSTTCVSGLNNFCLAVGLATTNSISQPLLAATTNNLSNWNIIPIKDIPDQGLLGNSSCTKTGSICIAVGYSQGNQDEPLIVASNDGAKSWTVKGITQTTFPEGIKSFTCDQTKTYCVAVGEIDTSNADCPICSKLVSYISKDGGITWQPSNSIYQPPNYHNCWLNSVVCSSDGKHCVTVGGAMPGSFGAIFYIPLILDSDDGGNNWIFSVYPLLDHYPHDELTAVDCDQNGLRCTTLGTWDESGNHPLSYISNNSGANWEFSRQPPVLPYPYGAPTIKLLTCDKLTMQCKACIEAWNNDYPPKKKEIIYQSNDAGDHWKQIDVNRNDGRGSKKH